MFDRVRGWFLVCALSFVLPGLAAADGVKASPDGRARPSRIIVPPAGVQIPTPPVGSDIVIEGEPPTGGGGEPPVVLEGLTLRQANVYLNNGLESLVSRMLPLYSPGNALSYMLVESVGQVGVSGYLPPLSNGTYAYAPNGADDMKFNQVNAYFQAHQFLSQYFSAYGWDASAYPVRILVNAATDPSGIIGLYSGGYVALYNASISGALRHTAKDGDVVRHELAHAALVPVLPQAPVSLGPEEFYAIHEGMADYYAMVSGGNGKLMEYLANSTNGLKDITISPVADFNMSRYELMKANPYEAGRIMNGALMTARATMGTVVDELVVAATQLNAAASFRSLADGIRRADIELYNGQHLDTLNAVFAARGITPGSTPSIDPVGPEHVSRNTATTYYANVLSGYGPFTFEWQTSTNNGSTWTTIGTGVVADLSFAANCILRCRITDQVGAHYQSYALSITTYDGPVPPVLTTVTINGPSSVPSGGAAHYSFSANTQTQPNTFWTIILDGGGQFSVQAETVDLTVFQGFTLKVAANGVTGGHVETQIHVDVTGSTDFEEFMPGGSTSPQPVASELTAGVLAKLAAVHSRSSGVLMANVSDARPLGLWTASVFDAAGRKVSQASAAASGGALRVWDPSGAKPGVYFIQLNNGARSATYRTVLMP